MDSRNPVLTREFSEPRVATFHEPPTGGPLAPTRTMTLDDVVVKTGVMFLVLVVTAVGGWNLVASSPVVGWVAALAAFGVAMGVIFRREPSPTLVLLYSGLEGLFLGGISRWYALYGSQGRDADPTIVLQAVIGTFVAFGVMLLLYRSGRLRATPRFQRMMVGALV